MEQAIDRPAEDAVPIAADLKAADPKSDPVEGKAEDEKPSGFRVQEIETGETIKTHASLEELGAHLAEVLSKLGRAVIVRAVKG